MKCGEIKKFSGFYKEIKMKTEYKVFLKVVNEEDEK